MRHLVIHKDCLEALPLLHDIDAVVTDPPYHLTSNTGRFASAPRNKKTVGDGPFGRHATGFMGKQWDGGDIAFRAETWSLVMAAMKPGAHLLAFGGTRTFHRLAVAIEDAGFEIRDTFMWVYGTGFPKSLDVSKAIDKARTEDIEPVRVICRAIRQAMDNQKLKSRDLVQYFNNCNPRLVDHWAARDTDSQPSLPTWDQWIVLREVLSIGDAYDEEVRRLNDRKNTHSDVWNTAEIVGEHSGQTPGFGDHRFSKHDALIRAPSLAAREWEGWGTAVKPAWEPIILARKPLEGTVAQNVQKYGTGGLNIDGCRVEPTGESRPREHEPSQDRRYTDQGGTNFAAKPGGYAGGAPEGRFPANLIHDGSDEVVGLFPQSTGQLAAVGPENKNNREIYGSYGPRDHTPPRNDTGSAARFFYCAKASKEERAGSKHPTVKPLALIRYLIRLITPPDGVVLDPFAGSGSTGAAALREGFRTILIEREAEYINDINRRLQEMT